MTAYTRDRNDRRARRGYALPRHNRGDLTIGGRSALPGDWPPGSENQTGVGIFLDGRNSSPSRWETSDDTAAFGGPGRSRTLAPRHQPAVNASMLLDQIGTIMVTERIDDGNYVGKATEGSATIASARNHIGDWNGRATRDQEESALHLDLWNYLFADGHVEFVSQGASYDPGNIDNQQTGGWSIRAGD